jgi:uncharacterized membrane protein
VAKLNSAGEKTEQQTGAGRRTPVIMMALIAVTTALVFLSTFIFQVPIPATQGYFNLGDIMIFITALTFGPEVGGFSGGVGSALSDILSPGGSPFAPFTLIIKGSEGLVAGLISRRLFRGRDLASWISGSTIMVGGYFLAEWYFIALVFGASDFTGFVAASAEVPFNVLQVVAGGGIGIPVSMVLRRALRDTPLSFSLPKTDSKK